MEQELEFYAEINDGSSWRGLEIVGDLEVGTEGVGQVEQQFRNIEATSNFYDGNVITHTSKQQVPVTMMIRVRGVTQYQMRKRAAEVTSWFERRDFTLRMYYDDAMETYRRCNLVSWSKNTTHVYLHACLAEITLQFSCDPKIELKELV